MEVERIAVRNAYSSSEGTGTSFFSGVGTLWESEIKDNGHMEGSGGTRTGLGRTGSPRLLDSGDQHIEFCLLLRATVTFGSWRVRPSSCLSSANPVVSCQPDGSEGKGPCCQA